MKRDICTGIVDQIRQKAKGWSTRHLSPAGKMTLLKAVLSAMPNHSMSCYKLPKSLCKRIQSALIRFWWDSKPDERKISWVAWSTMTKSKRDGGLGFRDIQCFNDALLAKLSWRIMNSPECLLARIMKGKYFPYQDLLQATAPNSCSHGWRGILIGRNLLRDHLGWAIGDGESASVWKDLWLSTSACECPIAPPTKDSEFIKVAGLFLSSEREWDAGKVQALLPHLKDNILSIKPSKKGGPDKRI
ncbi:uncharacterized mitochondrial protein AtMg00310-like [Brassica napus]|uniref:uncharacterized mitochondrial protein AtMg00310-like n=1 Tax=Brassica napus TaxID=3708 RepID=UPI002079C381|nr:uncharacterized mitochondrial protein AtMg00310-like [Brassica napus]